MKFVPWQLRCERSSQSLRQTCEVALRLLYLDRNGKAKIEMSYICNWIAVHVNDTLRYRIWYENQHAHMVRQTEQNANTLTNTHANKN